MKRAGEVMAWTIAGLNVVLLVLSHRYHLLEIESVSTQIRLEERNRCHAIIQENDSIWLAEFQELKRRYRQRQVQLLDSINEVRKIELYQQEERLNRASSLRELKIRENYKDSLFRKEEAYAAQIRHWQHQYDELEQLLIQKEADQSLAETVLAGKLDLPSWNGNDGQIYGLMAFFGLIMILALVLRWRIYRNQFDGFV